MEAKRKRTAIVDRRFALDGAGKRLFERENAMRGRVTAIRSNVSPIVNLGISGNAYAAAMRAPDAEDEITVNDAIIGAARYTVDADTAAADRETLRDAPNLPPAPWRTDVLLDAYTVIEARAEGRKRRGHRNAVVAIVSAAADADAARAGIAAYATAAGYAR